LAVSGQAETEQPKRRSGFRAIADSKRGGVQNVGQQDRAGQQEQREFHFNSGFTICAGDCIDRYRSAFSQSTVVNSAAG
jgi:hypothetical protein